MTAAAELEGRKILVTGAGSGIGAAVARAFASHGADLHLVGSPRSESAQLLAAELDEHSPGRVSGSGVDVADDVALGSVVAAAAQLLGGIDCVVTSAGVSAARGTSDVAPLCELTPAQFREVFDINVRGTWSVIRHAITHLLQAPGVASVITLGSVASKRPTHGAYSVSKSAVWMLTRALADEYGPSGVRFNCLAPGFTDTPMLRRIAAEQAPGVDDPLAARAARVPLRRVGDPGEIADAAVFLAGPRSSYLTGSLVHPDGGLINANAGG